MYPYVFDGTTNSLDNFTLFPEKMFFVNFFPHLHFSVVGEFEHLQISADVQNTRAARIYRFPFNSVASVYCRRPAKTSGDVKRNIICVFTLTR